MERKPDITGAGLGLRRALLDSLAEHDLGRVGFLEIAPENWIGVGGRSGRRLQEYSQRFPLVCHGLSLSLGAPEPLDEAFLEQVGAFLHDHRIRCYSEHLSYCSEHGHLYDLMPIPFTEEAVDWVAGRIARAQEITGYRLAVENISYYAAPGQELSELEFVTRVLEAADCDLLLDVNNVYVNATNHGYEPRAFIDALPAERIAYVHIAGHYQEAEDLIIDTHGAPVIDPVWALLDHTYQRFGPLPTLLERDFNFPPVEELLAEVDTIRAIQARHEQAPERHPK